MVIRHLTMAPPLVFQRIFQSMDHLPQMEQNQAPHMR